MYMATHKWFDGTISTLCYVIVTILDQISLKLLPRADPQTNLYEKKSKSSMFWSAVTLV